MKKMILLHSDKWTGVFTDTDGPTAPDDGAPPPEEPFGSPEPPVNTGFDRAIAFNI